MLLPAGYTSLAYLKSRLLPAAAAGKTDWDETIAQLGRATARWFAGYCCRNFDREEAAVEYALGNSQVWVMLRYPVEKIVSLQVSGRGNVLRPLAVDWTLNESSGVLQFLSDPAGIGEKVMITYAGGYWLDPRDGTSAPTLDGALPATPLPDDLLDAWVSQCQATAERRGLFSAAAIRSGKEASEAKANDPSGLLAEVVEVLRPHRRYGGN